MLIEDLLIELRLISLAYEQIDLQLQEVIANTFVVLRKNGHEKDFDAMNGLLTANMAVSKSLKDLVNEYQENVNKNYPQLLKNEI
jgi:hypothetical protein